MSNPIEIAKEIVSVLPDINRCAFMAIHNNAGERVVYGYFYGSKLYGSININSYQGYTYRIDIENGEYILR